MVMEKDRPTSKLSNIPQTCTAKEVYAFLSTILGSGSVLAVEIFSDHKNWKSRGFGRVQFTSLASKSKAHLLSSENMLVFRNSSLALSETYDDIIIRPVDPAHRIEDVTFHAGFMGNSDTMCVLESWKNVRCWVMPERNRVEVWIKEDDDKKNKGFLYKLEVQFQDVLEAAKCDLTDGKVGLLLKVNYAPKIFQKNSGTNVNSKFSSSRYFYCEEDFEYQWVRTTDFSKTKSIGQSTSFCLMIDQVMPDSDIFTRFPYFNDQIENLILEDWERGDSASEITPLVRSDSEPKLAYEVLFQLNSLVHVQKLSPAAVDANLIESLSSLTVDEAIIILQKFHKLKSVCYEPISLIKTYSHILRSNYKNLPSSSQSRLKEHNVMSIHRVLITPTKIYCLGPELESSNYVVQNFAPYASDFVRVSFVDEDWSKISPNALSVNVGHGIFSKPSRTKIYHRILSILQNGFVIGDKKFEFLAFSASQLRSSSVWMFASNEYVKAEEIREWMGCFNKIRSISKCAARMGQLFSSSRQTFIVPAQDVEIIPDVEITYDGIGYCFSDGIGKVSLSFARQIAQKCGLRDSQIPSAFQIRYGGYKGVIAVDRNSFRKLSLRSSMLKFESKNRMLNITKWSESMPCYLNREIVSLLSTLGVKDEVFEAIQHDQLCILEKMLVDRDAALSVLGSMGGDDILVKMLLQGYEPNSEPYLSMMLQSFQENQLSDLRNRCRVFVPKGRILIGCLDETGILEYGQVYVRVTMTKEELQSTDESCFIKVDDTTAIISRKVVVTKNPCLHPGDIRVLDAVCEVELEEKGLIDCIVFPQKGKRPHPNECSGGDLDGDQFFISWDEGLVPSRVEEPMEYIGGRPRIMDHDVTLKEIQKFFVDYMISDTLGTISTAHLVHADREPSKAMDQKCLQLANLHSMAVDFAKTGAPAEMPNVLKPRDFPDFMERGNKPSYTSEGVIGKLYRATFRLTEASRFAWSQKIAEETYDCDLEAYGFEEFLEAAVSHRDMYVDRLTSLMIFYGAKDEDEILSGNLRNRLGYLQRDNRRYYDMKDRIALSIKTLQREAKGWFENSCNPGEHQKLASAWYHVTYHPKYYQEEVRCLSFPWIVGNTLLSIKSSRNSNISQDQVSIILPI